METTPARGRSAAFTAMIAAPSASAPVVAPCSSSPMDHAPERHDDEAGVARDASPRDASPRDDSRPRGPAGDPASSRSLLVVTTSYLTLRSFLLPYAAHFRALGWRVDAAANGVARDDVLRASFDHVHELPLSRSVRNVTGMVRAERELERLLDTDVDIVHVHTPIAGFLARLAARRRRTVSGPAVIYTAHGFHFFKGGYRALNSAFLAAERVAGRWTDQLVVINQEDYEAARRQRIVPAWKLLRMPGIGIDTDAWSPERIEQPAVDAARECLGIRADDPMFVIVGELNRNKRQRDVIEALLAMRRKDAHLVLLGGGRSRPALESAVKEHGLGDRVHVLGFMWEIQPIVRAATAVILPSKREGLARSVMEALSLEVPVIASAARGNRELVGTDGGIVVPVGDVQGYADAMDRLADAPEVAREMGRSGRRRMVSEFDQRVLIKMHEAMYREVLGRRAPLRP